MKQIAFLPSFLRTIEKLSDREKLMLEEALGRFESYLTGQPQGRGFRFKRVGQRQFEFRVDLKLRVILKVEGEVYYLVLVGSHDDIKKYLKNQ